MLLLVGAGLGLLAGTWTGLARAGVHRPIGPYEAHGVVMVLGFLGTLIGLERAVALGRRWALLAPAASSTATLWLLLALPSGGAGVLLTAAGVGVLLAYVAMLRVRWDTHLAVMAGGAVAWIVAATAWTVGASAVHITPLLAAFLVLTIVGERLELSRLTLPSRGSRHRFLVAVWGFGVAAGVTLVLRGPGLVVAGVALLAQVVWLARHDVARRTVRRPGLPRYIALCLLGGYVWLAVSAILWIAVGAGVRGPFLHDAMVHALFLGFVLSMVMGHAPIIVPAVLRTPLRFLRVAYVPLVLLHASVALRVAVDVLGGGRLREVALHGNVTALLLFAGVTIVAVRRGRRDPIGATP